jgi:hypothetical protein
LVNVLIGIARKWLMYSVKKSRDHSSGLDPLYSP